MINALLNRLLLSIPVLIGVVIFGFLLIKLAPGDPAQIMAGPAATPEIVAQIREEMGLDRSLIAQLGAYAGRLVQGDLGRSLISNKTVVSELGAAIVPTVELMVASLIWAVPLGIGMGTLAAVKRGSVIDRIIMALSVAGVSLPIFFIALVLMQFLGVTLQWFPFMGRGGPLWTLDGLRHIVIPALSLGLIFVGPVARMTRSSVLEVLRLDHVRTARAKGLRETRVILRHALKPALLPVISYLGPVFVTMITGSVVVDVYFSTGGIGRSFVDAALNRDYAMMMGVTILVGALTIFFNLVVDILYAWIDPKIRY